MAEPGRFEVCFEPTEEQRGRIFAIQNALRRAALVVEEVLPAGREKTHVYAKLEEAAMWAVKSVTHN